MTTIQLVTYPYLSIKCIEYSLDNFLHTWDHTSYSFLKDLFI